MATVPDELHGPSDAELIQSVRDGTIDAYGSLYERHVGAAYNLARQLTRSTAEADDLVSEAFAKVLDTLRAGRGPDSAFRAYLLTALRHTAYDRTRRDRKVELSDDVSTVSGIDEAAVSVPFSDTAVAGLDRTLAARAFAQLPERWQAVLWHTEVEGQPPGDVAPLLGLSANGVSALAYRAREGLRQAYLQVHLAETTENRCRTAADRLGAWTRGGLSRREQAQVEAHLDECARCRALAAELADVNGAMRGFVAPLVLGAGAAAYLAAAGGAAKTAAVAATAATAGTAGGAAGAAAAGPRQFLGVAASATALVAAIAVGLGSGGPQEIPAAQRQPVTTPAPAPTPSAKPVAPPAPQQPPATQPPPAPQQPSSTPPSTPPSSPAPAPRPPELTASGPTTTVTLTPGAGPVDVPITVHNTGGTTSPPVRAALTLPAGVHAVPAGQRFGPAPLLDLDPARAAAPTAVTNCPGGDGTVTCRSSRGLPPSGTATLKFRLLADRGSAGGVVTGSVGAGTSIRVSIRVRVVVTPPPAVDAVQVTAAPEWLDLLAPGLRWHQVVDVTARNRGTSTKPITVQVDQPGLVLASTPGTRCSWDGTVACTSPPVAPGHVVVLRVQVAWHPVGDYHHPWSHRRLVQVTATLGTATDRTTVQLHCWQWPFPVPPPPIHQPTLPPSTHPPVTSTTTPPAPTTTTPTTTSPGTTTTTPTTSTPPGDRPPTGSSGSNGSGSAVVTGPPRSSGTGSVCVRPVPASPSLAAEIVAGRC